MSRTLPFIGLLLMALAAVFSRVPHMRLASQFLSGAIDGRPLPVVDVIPAPFQEDTIQLRCGELTLEAPSRAFIRLASADEPSAILIESAGLTCRVVPPRYDTGDDALALPGGDGAPGQDETSRRAAVCRANERDLSFWMSAAQVQQLQERLETRRLICPSAERVEIVRGVGLSGLLSIWEGEGCVCMSFEYSSPDGHWKGAIPVLVKPASRQAVDMARSLLSSVRLDPAP